MEVLFTKHAQEKFDLLKRHGVIVSRDLVLLVLRAPALIDRSRHPLFIAQGNLDERHVLRIVCRRESNSIIVITFYPGRRTVYEKK